MVNHEQEAKAQGFKFIIGVDEAGRGPLAGPVVAGAVLFKSDAIQFSSKIGDSKILSPKQREQAFLEICEKAYVGTGIISASVIDTVNILEATYLAMRNAVDRLVDSLPDGLKAEDDFQKQMCLLVDGNRFKTELPFAFKTIVQGDRHVQSISCASIIAKVTRDRILLMYDQVFPQYGFKRHKGYPTAWHRQAIKENGLSLIHRRSFSIKHNGK